MEHETDAGVEINEMARNRRDSALDQYRKRVGRHDGVKCKENTRRLKLMDEYRSELDPNAFKDLFILSTSFFIATGLIVYIFYYCLTTYSDKFRAE